MFGLFAFLEITDLPSAFYLGLRFVVAAAAGLVGFYLSGPVITALHRMAFHKPISPRGHFISRLGVAVLLAVLAFWLIPIGPGGGWGTESGTGNNSGTGQTPDGNNGKQPTSPQDPKTTPKEVPPGKLVVEMVTANSDEDNKYYLIHKKAPAKTIKEVEEYLRQNKGKWGEMEIIIYRNSINDKAPSVKKLEEVARQYDLTPKIPTHYLTIQKAVKTSKD